MWGRAANGGTAPAGQLGGLALLLKTFGIDAGEISQWIAWAQVNIPAWMKSLADGVQQMNAQLAAIRDEQTAAKARHDEMMRVLYLVAEDRGLRVERTQ
jgi:hypothetical protein